MTRKEKKSIEEWAATLSNEELDNEYYNAVFNSLGSQTEEMYELGYDIRDIEEQEKFEKYLCEQADLIGAICERRGIKLWCKT